jgi:cyclopropane fatty-acyl-phospholipid synthase-like methyltransferase
VDTDYGRLLGGEILGDQSRIALFDRWAERYDQQLVAPRGVFEGYHDVLERVLRDAEARPGMQVLDLGVGTGNLAKRFLDLGCTLWCVDFSPGMLDRARAKLPPARFIEMDLRSEWTCALDRRFDRIVSTYVFHEFDLDTKVRLLRRGVSAHLKSGGRVVVGDIAFPSMRALVEAGADAWDEEEHYWAAQETIAACAHVGLRATYTQVSWCGGVFVVVPAE